MAKLVVLVLLLLALAALVGSHVFVLRSVARGFGVERWTRRRAVLVGVALLSLGFPLSMLLAKTLGGPVTGALFVVAAWWMGFFINLFFAVVVARAVGFVAQRVRRELAPERVRPAWATDRR